MHIYTTALRKLVWWCLMIGPHRRFAPDMAVPFSKWSCEIRDLLVLQLIGKNCSHHNVSTMKKKRTQLTLTGQRDESVRLPRHLRLPLVHVRHRAHLTHRLAAYLHICREKINKLNVAARQSLRSESTTNASNYACMGNGTAKRKRDLSRHDVLVVCADKRYCMQCWSLCIVAREARGPGAA
jgi:hypothetical protein